MRYNLLVTPSEGTAAAATPQTPLRSELAMNDPKETPVGIEEIIAIIHALQEEIVEREARIADLVSSVDSPSRLGSLVEDGEERRRFKHLERLIGDWDRLVARSRAVSGDDIDLAAALVRLVGDLLVIQQDGLDAKWISRLEAYLERERSRVS